MSASLALWVLAAVTMQRGAELGWSFLNTQRLRVRGAREEAPEHYPLIVLLHFAWLLGLWIFAWNRPVSLPFLAVYLALEILRAWVMVTLGRRWTTRILVVPAEAPLRQGPYRFLSHPNYVVVAGEIACLPLVFGLTVYAIVFSVLNGAVLWLRISRENRAWRDAAAAR